MYTNQDGAPHQTRVAHACTHAAGEATLETCGYLRLLRELRLWTERAEVAHRADEPARAQMGALWLLQARLSYALDACPNSTEALHAAPLEPVLPGYGRDGHL